MFVTVDPELFCDPTGGAASAETPASPGVTCDMAENANQLTVPRTIPQTIPQKERRRALVLPREHGAWGMLLVPLATGAAVGLLSGGRIVPVLLLTTAVLALFWLRTPAESWLGTGAVRAQTAEERRHVRKFVLPLATVAGASLTALFWRGKNLDLIVLGLIATPVFVAQMYLQKLGRRTRMGAEVVGA